MLVNKKAFSEVTSFVLLFSIIAVASTIAYAFSKNVIDDKMGEIDLANANSYMKKFNEEISAIKTFEGSAFSINLNFKSGEYQFVGDKIYYYSMMDYHGLTDYCVNNICYLNNGGSEKIYVELGDSYTFLDNFSLVPGNYLITFINLKNETKIELKIT